MIKVLFGIVAIITAIFVYSDLNLNVLSFTILLVDLLFIIACCTVLVLKHKASSISSI